MNHLTLNAAAQLVALRLEEKICDGHQDTVTLHRFIEHGDQESVTINITTPIMMVTIDKISRLKALAGISSQWCELIKTFAWEDREPRWFTADHQFSYQFEVINRGFRKVLIRDRWADHLN
jgi:hypothetical protein